jgi:hypothetical protein
MKTNSFHKHIEQKLIEKRGIIDNTIKREEVKKILYFSHIPTKLHTIFLEELVHLKIIKIKNKRSIEVLGIRKDQ